LVRRTSDISELPPPSSGGVFELAYGDITDYQSLLDAFSGCQVIFHAAAIVEPWLPDPSKFFSVSTSLTSNFFTELINEKNMKLIVVLG
jgi:farnesol dehydrogenase